MTPNICPRCAWNRMYVAEAGDLRFDVCGACGGIRLAPTDADRLFGGLFLAADARPQRSNLFCPTCVRPMDEWTVPGAPVQLDTCPEHGTWFDRNEVARLMTVVAARRGRALPRFPELVHGSSAPAEVAREAAIHALTALEYADPRVEDPGVDELVVRACDPPDEDGAIDRAIAFAAAIRAVARVDVSIPPDAALTRPAPRGGALVEPTLGRELRLTRSPAEILAFVRASVPGVRVDRGTLRVHDLEVALHPEGEGARALLRAAPPARVERSSAPRVAAVILSPITLVMVLLAGPLALLVGLLVYGLAVLAAAARTPIQRSAREAFEVDADAFEHAVVSLLCEEDRLRSQRARLGIRRPVEEAIGDVTLALTCQRQRHPGGVFVATFRFQHLQLDLRLSREDDRPTVLTGRDLSQVRRIEDAVREARDDLPWTAAGDELLRIEGVDPRDGPDPLPAFVTRARAVAARLDDVIAGLPPPPHVAVEAPARTRVAAALGARLRRRDLAIFGSLDAVRFSVTDLWTHYRGRTGYVLEVRPPHPIDERHWLRWRAPAVNPPAPPIPLSAPLEGGSELEISADKIRVVVPGGFDGERALALMHALLERSRRLEGRVGAYR